MSAPLETTDRRTYMREWKQKAYKENPDKIKKMNRAYYYQKKNNIPIDELHKYGASLPLVYQARIALAELRTENRQYVFDIINEQIQHYPVKIMGFPNELALTTPNIN